MPDPTPTTRDRELAAQALDNMPALLKSMEQERAGGGYKRFLLHPEARAYLIGEFEAVAARARQEGREEGIEAAVKELRMLGNSRGAAQLNVRLITQPAPDRAKE